MRTLKLISRLGALALMLATAASSQVSGAKHMTANIPFDFTLGDTTYKSGTYEVSVGWEGVIWFYDSDGHVKTINSQSVSTGKNADHSKLVFRHGGDRYFLAQIWMLGNTSGREIPPRRLEREIMSRSAPQTVDVIARK